VKSRLERAKRNSKIHKVSKQILAGTNVRLDSCGFKPCDLSPFLRFEALIGFYYVTTSDLITIQISDKLILSVEYWWLST